jgi:hypothetical protein
VAGEDPPGAGEVEEAEQQRFQYEVLAEELRRPWGIVDPPTGWH